VPALFLFKFYKAFLQRFKQSGCGHVRCSRFKKRFMAKATRKTASKKTNSKKAASKKGTAKKSAAKKGKTNKLGVKNSLVNNINAKKKKGTSKSAKKSTVSKKAYRDMENQWAKKK